MPVPWIAPDEMTYGLLGQSLYRHGSLAILGGPTPYFSAVVPAVVGLPLSLGDLAFGYDLLRVLQALAMSLTAVPVFLWGRTLVAPRWALVAAALTLTLPGLVYSGLVMTEVLFYPALVLAAWAAARAIQEPSLGRQTLLAGAIALAALTRLQALVLVPAALTAFGVDAALARTTATLRRSWPTFALAVVVAVVLAGARVAGSGGLGGYEVVSRGSYELGTAARFVVYHAASLTILVGVFPVLALLVLVADAVRHGESDPARRAYLAVALSFSVWLIVEVGVFASRYVGRLAERDLIGLAPLLFLGFAVWLQRRPRRAYWTTSLAVGAVAAPIAVLPLHSLVTAYAPPDAPSLAALWDLRRWSSLRALEIVFFVGVGVAIALFALVPRRFVVALPILLVLVLAGGSIAASREATNQARLRQATYLGPDRRWIDHAADGPVALLYTHDSGWVGAWEALFWNRRITAIDGLDGAKVFGPVPTQPVQVRPDGIVSGKGKAPSFVVAPLGEVESVPAYAFKGKIVAYVRRPGSLTGGSALWRIDPPLRLSYRTSGLEPNGDMYAGGDGRRVAYGCSHGVFRITLLVKEPQTVTIYRNGTVYRRLHFAHPGPNEPWRGVIPAVPRPGIPAGKGTCQLDVVPTGLLGSTVFEVD
ncbi:MAG TPA: glycosyltransferase family 39 protein [Gaiellaceae bacterium]|nr:glycosyltransferase family 39 protein [Gaiellaceae bacterium]